MSIINSENSPFASRLYNVGHASRPVTATTSYPWRTMKKSDFNPLHIRLAAGALGLSLMACSMVSVNLSGTSGLSNVNSTAAAVGSPIPIETDTAVLSAVDPPVPSGHIVFISSRDGKKKLYVMKADGTEQHPLTTGTSEDETPRWSPDGSKIAYVSTVNDNTDIYILDLATGKSQRLTTDSARDAAPSWSPDGTRLAFESFQKGNLDIYVINIDGTGLTRLTDNPAGDTNPQWSPDGSTIAFMSSRSGINSDVYLVAPNGSGETSLTSQPPPDSDPVWSPDSSQLAFRDFPTQDVANICVVNRDGSNRRCLTDSQWENGIPAWSPDGLWLAFRSIRGGGAGIDLVKVQDGTMISLVTGAALKGDPVWSPDGAWLAYQACPKDNQSQGCQGNTNMDIYEIAVSTHEVVQLTNTSMYNGQPDWTAH